MTNGLRPQQLVIIAARPSMGKTSLAMNIAERVAVDDGFAVGVFSLEMSSQELVHRMACCRARVDSAAAGRGELTDADIKRLTVATAKIGRAPLHLCDQGGLTIGQLTARARRMAQRHKVKLIIVDYLQLLRSGERRAENRTADVTIISNGLKALAKELRVPVIACAQLNRDVEKDNRAPRLSDLRDSGSIEQDADVVGLLHKRESGDAEGQPTELIIAKQRNGPTGPVNLVFLPRFTRFESAGRVAKA